jgi:hypothetical protein
MPRTPVYIICSPRPFVGKTLVARLLSEFLLLQRGAVVSFDINLKEPSLIDFLPAVTETAEVEDTYGKMALMDRLIIHDGVAKVIDLGFHAFNEFFKMCEEIGFMKEAVRNQIAPIVLFVADIDRGSAWSLETLRAQVPANALVTIENEYVLRGALPEFFAQGRILRITALPNFLKTYTERAGFSFTDYLRSEKDSSSELHQWIRKNYANFHELEQKLVMQR